VPNWLADQAGPDGHVLATDIDTSWIDGMAPHVEVRQHDIARDDLPSGVFDLIHARLVLCWIPERDKALRRMAGALRPGGWLLIEDFDPGLQSAAYIGAYLPDHDNANKLRAGFGALLAQRGADPAYGRKLPGSSPYQRVPVRRGVRQEHPDLAVLRPPRSPGVLPLHAGRPGALLQEPGVISDQHPVRPAQLLHHVSPDIVADPLHIPVRPAQQPLHPIRADLARPFGQRPPVQE
jgi:SAM-dependent methyltransferase